MLQRYDLCAPQGRSRLTPEILKIRPTTSSGKMKNTPSSVCVSENDKCTGEIYQVRSTCLLMFLQKCFRKLLAHTRLTNILADKQSRPQHIAFHSIGSPCPDAPVVESPQKFQLQSSHIAKSAKTAALVAHSRSGGQEQGVASMEPKQVDHKSQEHLPGELIGTRSTTKWGSIMVGPLFRGAARCACRQFQVLQHALCITSHWHPLMNSISFLFYNYISYHSHISSILYLLLSLSMSSNLFLALFISEKVLLTPRGSLPHARHEGGRSLHDQLFCLGLRCVQKMPKQKRQHPAISSRPSRAMLDK